MMDEFNNENNEIIEIGSQTEDTLFEEDFVSQVKENEIKATKASNPSMKKSSGNFKKFWNNLSKGKKILLIILPIIIILLVVALCLLIKLGKKDNKVEDKPHEENITLQSDNFIYNNGILEILNEAEDTVGSYECVNKDVKKCYVAYLTNEDNFDQARYVDSDDNLIVKRSKVYEDRFVFIYDEESVILYDLTNNEEIDRVDEIIENASEDLVVFKKNNQYGIYKLTKSMPELILSGYNFLGIVDSNDTFVAKDKGLTYLVKEKDKVVSGKLSGDIKKFNDKYISVKSEENYILYDLKGQKVLSGEDIQFIDFYEGFVLVVEDNQLYVYDQNLFKLNQTGIKLKSKDYNKKYVFDSKKVLKETKQSYILEILENGNIDVTLSDNSKKSIYVNEALLSSKFEYVSYYDGVLYFYEDAEKTELVGTYKCSNKNSINSSEDYFENCFVAEESSIVNSDVVGFAPIINDEYVFIHDAKSGSETIYLYNLKEAKQTGLPKYLKVDTKNAGTGITKVTLLNTLIATQSASDKGYGLISFTTSGASTVIPFRSNDGGSTFITKELKFLNTDYIIACRENKNYLYDRKGNLLASSIFDIIDYKNAYLLVKDDGYIVYKMSSDGENGSIISDKLDYIKYEENYFIGIKDNKLNLYKYSNGKTKILDTDVEVVLQDNNYEASYNISNNNGGIYEITVFDEDGNTVTVSFKEDGRIIQDEEE